MTLLSNPPSPQTTTKTSKQHLTILPQNPVASKRKKIPTYPIKPHFKADNQAHLHSVITPQQRYHIRLSSNYKIIPMRVLPTLVLLLLALAVAQEEACGCLNGGRCLPGKDQRCVCREGFLGRQCRLPAQELTDKAAPASLSNEYRYFYFAPNEVNYYRLSFTLCMQENPSRRGTLFYVETERNDGSLRQTPSMFETAKIQLQEQSCTTFSTHYISIKRRDDESFRKIVIGLRAVQEGEDEKKYGAFLRYGQQEQQQVGKEKDNKNGYEQFSQERKNTPSKQLNQQITIKMTTEVYLQTSNFSTFLILFTAFVLLILLTAFITYVRRKYTLDSLQLQLDSLHLQADLNRLRRELHSLNPEDPRPHTKNSLHNLEIFMPVTHYGTPQSIFIPHLLTNKEKHQEPLQAETCSICLLQFQTGDEIRTTPCSHQYHRECIDNWCETRLSCPICRRQLDFTREVRQLYYELLRNELSI